jgi:glycosyltransferase involved in cell wall biosynthesis
MKKRVLFVIPNLTVNGASKSLVSLLSVFDFEKYDVDLLLLEEKGMFLKYVPEEVRLIKTPSPVEELFKPLKESVKSLYAKRKFNLIYKRIFASVIAKLKLYNKKSEGFEAIFWNVVSNSIPILEKRYDVAIAYLDQAPMFYIVEKVNSNKKIVWNHNDYIAMGLDDSFNLPYYEKIDYIVPVSEQCKNTFDRVFPDFKKKTHVVKNIISPSIINQMSKKSEGFQDVEFDGIRLLTIGRLSYQKGLDMAIIACKKLIESGKKVRWYVLGDGHNSESENFRKLIKKLNLEDSFIFLGTTSNPYSYLRQADIYIQPSRYEGLSIAVNEAKVLKKPIIVTDSKSFVEQITNDENGLVVSMNPDAIYMGIKHLLENPEVCNRFSNRLEFENIGNENEVEKVYKLINY